MNPHAEAWRAAKQQQEGQNEGQVAGVTLVMINSVFQQIQHEFAEAKQTSADIKTTLLGAHNEFKNANEVIPQSIQKALKSGQDQMREVGLDVKAQVGEACQRVEDLIPKIEQVGDKIHQSITPVVAHLDDLNQTWKAVDFSEIKELNKSVVRLEKRTEDVKKDIQNTQANTTKWSKILFGLLGGFAACFIAFCVAFWFISGLQLKIFKENFEFKKANRDAVIAYQNLKDKYDDKVKEYNKLSAFTFWHFGNDKKAFEAKYREFEEAMKQK